MLDRAAVCLGLVLGLGQFLGGSVFLQSDLSDGRLVASTDYSRANLTLKRGMVIGVRDAKG